MKKEAFVFLVVVGLTGLLYLGIEPIAHSLMHPAVEPASYDFSSYSKKYAKLEVENGKASKDKLAKIETFWNEVDRIDLAKGDAKKGAEVFMNAGCIGCHGVKVANFPTPLENKSASSAFGVVPPDLSDAGLLYEPKFLAALIKNPTIALHVEDKFNDTNPFSMPPFYGAGSGDIDQEIADMVAYLQSIAPKNISDKQAFENACQRCHDMRYDNGEKSFTDHENLKRYMGSIPPDLSMIVRSRSLSYLDTFINDPQKNLHGTAMPRVGLSENSQKQVLNYLEKIGDRKKEEREDLGFKMMIYFAILSVFAILWKKKVWKKVQ